ncbi:alpha-hydroxy acid oxidase [Diaminobutyricibacter sp. McL0618]|uniref:alpha-hydroxy acid oxidase n=1 Tax=Leifsonia sp. McL0618 TaxID=3415677 RepID=UPI003CF82766
MGQKIVNADDFRVAAKRRLPRMVYDYLEGGALDELTAAANERAFREIRLKQRIYADIADRDISTTVLGSTLSLPLMVSPMGLLGLFHPDADVGIARAAAQAGCVFIHSAWSSLPLEEVVLAAPENTWSQVQLWNDLSLTHDHIDRAKKTGRDVLVVAGDVAVSSKRERDMRHGLSLPPHPPIIDVINTALHPRWLLGMLRGPAVTWGNYTDNGRRLRMSELDAFMYRNQMQSAAWEHVERIRDAWTGKLVIKGVMAPEDARRAVEAGADGILVSNHGGRQFDSQPATIEVLPSIVAAVAGRCEVYVDSGVRRGSDILKANALGARAAVIGRPAAYALAARGSEGVEELFEILRSEYRVALGFVGRNSVGEIDGDVLANAAQSTPRIPALATFQES